MYYKTYLYPEIFFINFKARFKEADWGKMSDCG